jgi:hypothetical protein
MSYYTNENVRKLMEALNEAKQIVKNEEKPTVKISNSNSKMGKVASVSLLPFVGGCPDVCSKTCGEKCYAAKLALLRPSRMKSWAYNTALAIYKPLVYWEGVERAAAKVKYFRFHVSGDILNPAYFHHMVAVAKRLPGTEFLAFTKKWDVVNDFLSLGNVLPSNLHIMYSGWIGLTPANPYNMPETNVFPRNGAPAEGWKVCGGNCFNCAARGVGCWAAQEGDVIAFRLH